MACRAFCWPMCSSTCRWLCRSCCTVQQSIPAEGGSGWRHSLGMPPAALLRHLELPMLRAQVPGALVAIFLICLASTGALTLGGGPKASTIELAIYQALRFEFDLGRAAAGGGAVCALCRRDAGGEPDDPAAGALARGWGAVSNCPARAVGGWGWIWRGSRWWWCFWRCRCWR